MELEVYKKSDFYEDYISSQKEYYECENADAYFAERLAEKDKEVAELKVENARLTRELEHVKNGDCINTCDVLEKYGKELYATRRELWLARAERAKVEYESKWNFSTLYKDYIAKWQNIERKCLKKAEEYK